MDVFRRSAAARVIYRGTLALPPLSHCHQALLPLSFSSCLFFFLSLSLDLSPALIRYTRVAAEGDGGIPNERYDGISFPPCPSRLSLSGLLSFAFSPRCLRTSRALSLSRSLLSLGLVSVVSATSFAPHINARFIPQNPGRYRIYIFVASL